MTMPSESLKHVQGPGNEVKIPKNRSFAHFKKLDEPKLSIFFFATRHLVTQIILSLMVFDHLFQEQFYSSQQNPTNTTADSFDYYSGPTTPIHKQKTNKKKKSNSRMKIDILELNSSKKIILFEG